MLVRVDCSNRALHQRLIRSLGRLEHWFEIQLLCCSRELVVQSSSRLCLVLRALPGKQNGRDVRIECGVDMAVLDTALIAVVNGTCHVIADCVGQEET